MRDLPDGLYPVGDGMMPLSDLAMKEASPELEALLKRSARESGVEIIRDEAVELTCQALGFPDARFMVFWPSSSDRIHVLAPKGSVTGRA